MPPFPCAVKNGNAQSSLKGGDLCMRGSIQFDKRAKRYYFQIYWAGKAYKIWKYKGEPIWHVKTAERLAAVIRSEIEDETFLLKTYLPDSPLSLKGYSEMWLKTITACDNTKRVYRSDLQQSFKYFGEDADIRKISYAKLCQFYNELKLTDKGKYNVLGTLKSMLRFAYKNDDLKRIPPFPSLSQGQIGKVQFLTYEQQAEILQRVSDRDRLILEFGMEFGMRVQEVIALKWDCITDNEITIKRAISNGKLVERTKTGHIRKLGLTERSRGILQAARSQSTISSMVFVRNNRGLAYSGKYLNKIWKSATSGLGYRIKLQNALRHSLGCQLLEEGHSLELVAKALGHSSTAVTRRYAQRTNEAVNLALENRGRVVEFKKKEEGK